MNHNSNNKNIIANAAISLLPPTIREAIISDSSFQSNYNIEIDYKITINEIHLTVQRSIMYKSVRNLIMDKSSKQIFTDEHGRNWNLELSDDSDEIKIFLSHGENRFFINDFYAFSIDSTVRLHGLELNRNQFNLPVESFNKWFEILSQRPLTDDEIDDLHFDINDTPIKVADSIDSEIKYIKSSILSLIPKSERYYYRLVGNSQQFTNITEYTNNVLSNHINQLISWKHYEGFLLVLLLLHPNNNSFINIEHINEEELIHAYEWIQMNGDFIAKLRAVEIGLSIISTRPKLISSIKNIIEEILNDDPDNVNSRFKLLSSLIIYVDGELSRRKIFSGKPPYWRRLASIAHASIIERGIIRSNVDIVKFGEKIQQLSGPLFYLQNTIDLRLEPRWHPDFLSPRQLKYMFLFRIADSASNNISKDKCSSIYELLFDDSANIKESFITFPDSFLPGPLEGGLVSKYEPTQEQLKQIEEVLKLNGSEISTYNLLVYISLIFNINSHLAELLAEAIKGTKYYINKLENSDSLFWTIRELSIVAAITRSKVLSKEIKILVRRYRYSAEFKLPKDKDILICLITAAAYIDKTEWCEFVGEWITELAFQNMSTDEIKILYNYVTLLCHFEPQLWQTCSRAEAALSSCIGK